MTILFIIKFLHVPVSISNSSAPDLAISLAKEETSANGVDPLLIQKRALDAFKLEQLQKDLIKAKVSFLKLIIYQNI